MEERATRARTYFQVVERTVCCCFCVLLFSASDDDGDVDWLLLFSDASSVIFDWGVLVFVEQFRSEDEDDDKKLREDTVDDDFTKLC